MAPQPPTRRLGALALLLGLALFAIYNANGREIGSIDTQPTKFAARSLALTGSLVVDRDVERQPLFADRPSFVRDRHGHYRSAYSPVEPVIGGATAWLLTRVGVDLDAQFSANLVAVLTASMITAAAAVLVFLTVAQWSSQSTALWTALGLGLGTNFWPVSSQTMGQHDLVALGFAIAVFAWTRPHAALSPRLAWTGALGLALATTARFQTIPLACALGAGLVARVGWKRALAPLSATAASLACLGFVQWQWFGSVLGAAPALELLHPSIHGVESSLSITPWLGALGLLLSPNRGLLIFSPIVALALAGLAVRRTALDDRGGRWLAAGILLQFCAYSAYAVWWGGHTYGPRYMLDLLVPLSLFGAVAIDTWRPRRWFRHVAAVALTWSMLVAGTGAFFANPWNSTDDVDRHHARLWDWRDWQISTAWHAGLSRQNFNLFRVAGYRTPIEP